MAGILHTYIPSRVIDSNGIADGSQIAFYLTGTTTPTAIYSDEALTVPLANPVVVGAGAEVPSIYLDPAISYRRVVTYSDGSTQDLDPYAPISTVASAVQLGGSGSLSLTGTVADRLLREVHLQDVAGFTFDLTNPITAGEANKAALEAAWIALGAAGGGRIVFPLKRFYLAPCFLPQQVGIPMGLRGYASDTYTGSIIMPSVADSSAAAPTNYLIRIGDGDITKVGFVELEGFTIRPFTMPSFATSITPEVALTRFNINGLYVSPTNHLRIKNVFIQGIRGNGYWVQRAHNSEIVVHTLGCGDAVWNTFGHNIMPDPDGGVSNEVKLGGTTEQDVRGVRIHQAVLVRPMNGGMKFHGSTITKRLGEFYEVYDFDMIGVTSRGTIDDHAFYFGDRYGVNKPETFAPAVVGGEQVDGFLGRWRVRLYSNFWVNMGLPSGGATRAVVQYDCGGTGSLGFDVDIPVLPLGDAGTYGTNWYFAHLTNATAGNAIPDFTRVRRGQGAVETGLVRDERTLTKRMMTHQGTGATGVQLPLRTALQPNTVLYKVPGQTETYQPPAVAGVSPSIRSLAITFGTGAYQNKLSSLNDMHEIFADTVSASRRFPGVAFFRQTDAVQAIRDRIVGVTIVAEGIAAWSDANNWVLRLSRANGQSFDLKICNDRTFVANGATYPDAIDGAHSAPVLYSLKYWQMESETFSLFTTSTHILKAELVKTGTPADLVNFRVKIITAREAQ